MAIKVDETVEIDAPPERVWELVIDPRRHPEWVPSLRESYGLPDRPLEPGDTFSQRLCLVGQEVRMDWTLLEREDPRSAQWRATGPGSAEAHISFELSAENGGSRFRYVNEFDPPGGFLGRAAAMPAKRQARKSLAALKRAAEAAEGAHPS
jgi:uncharacterized protein YndB with AHSA1/START domain